jgi:hypothetical protein
MPFKIFVQVGHETTYAAISIAISKSFFHYTMSSSGLFYTAIPYRASTGPEQGRFIFSVFDLGQIVYKGAVRRG